MWCDTTTSGFGVPSGLHGGGMNLPAGETPVVADGRGRTLDALLPITARLAEIRLGGDRALATGPPEMRIVHDFFAGRWRL